MSERELPYLRWSKTRQSVRFDLAGSGVSTPTNEELELTCPDPLSRREASGYGDPELVNALAAWRGVPADCVLPVPGTSSANFIALAACANRGDRVLIEEPTYDPIRRAAALLALEVVPWPRLPAEGFAPDIEVAERALRNGTKAVVLTNLHNPSGRRCSDQDLAALAGRCAKHDAYLVVDEVYLDYAHVNRGHPRQTAFSLGPNVLTTGSLTKVYGLGPLRAGWLVAAPEMIDRARAVVDVLHGEHAAVAEHLTLDALRRIDRLAARTRRIYEAARPIFAAWLTGRADLTGCGNDGALFELLEVRPPATAETLTGLLVTGFDTQIVPGRFFGCPNHVRVFFGLPPAELREALTRIGDALDRLSSGPPFA